MPPTDHLVLRLPAGCDSFHLFLVVKSSPLVIPTLWLMIQISLVHSLGLNSIDEARRVKHLKLNLSVGGTILVPPTKCKAGRFLLDAYSSLKTSGN
jgi:hypothetical protein